METYHGDSAQRMDSRSWASAQFLAECGLRDLLHHCHTAEVYHKEPYPRQVRDTQALS